MAHAERARKQQLWCLSVLGGMGHNDCSEVAPAAKQGLVTEWSTCSGLPHAMRRCR